jgi:8-oxo-dGTP pyrophosphatase MutT (NUDIX family)
VSRHGPVVSQTVALRDSTSSVRAPNNTSVGAAALLHACIDYFDIVQACRRADLAVFVPWYIGTSVGHVHCGSVHRDRVPGLLRPGSPFRLVADRLVLQGGDFAARSNELATWLTSLWAANELKPRLGEMYPVTGPADPTPLLQVDPSAVTWLGVRSSGVHLNGYARTRGDLRLWVAVRARGKSTFPGHLDNIVAGGQAIGSTPLQTLVKECDEEAGLPADLAARAVPIGSISYVQQDRLSLKSDTLACFDLELPAAFVPRPADGEVEEFALWPVAKVAESLRDGTPWKPNSAMVTLDFLLRFGCLDAELPTAQRWRLWQALRGELP